jgi:hypothetical protein
MAAEAGGGVPFRVNKAEQRIILTPLESLNAPSKAGAMRAVYRVAPARSIIEIAEPESYTSTHFNNVWSPSVYVGENPNRVRLDGPHWNSENMIIVATADKWGTAEEGTLGPGTGLPNLLLKGGSWHVPNMGFGTQAELVLSTETDEIMNRVSFTLGFGKWRIEGSVDDIPVFSENVTSPRWVQFDKTFNLTTGSSMVIRITNAAQDRTGLFVRGTYLGVRVDQDNREAWLALGGKEGVNARKEVTIASADNMKDGKEWISRPAPDPSFERPFYGTVAGAPRKISAIGMKTRTPGALFKISYSFDNVDKDEDYENINWVQLPKYYKMTNGRVDVDPFKAKHVRLTITNLRPMLLREYQSESEA